MGRGEGPVSIEVKDIVRWGVWLGAHLLKDNAGVLK